MGLFSPKYPAGAEPARAPRPARTSRRVRQQTEHASLVSFCDASTAYQQAIAQHGRGSRQAKATKAALDAQPYGGE